MSTEQNLIKALKSQNIKEIDDCFRELYNKYKDLLFYISCNIVRDNTLAEDIVNETFMRFFNNINKIDINKNIKYWLVTTAKNLSIDESKKNCRFTEINEMIVGEDNIKDNNYQYMLNKFKDVLDEEEFNIIVLHLCHDYKFHEIATHLNKSVNTITTKYTRSLAKIREHYRKEDLI